jgi:hypothetical protein
MDGLSGRYGPDERRGRYPRQDFVAFSVIAGLAGLVSRMAPRAVCCSAVALKPVDQRAQAPEFAESARIIGVLEDLLHSLAGHAGLGNRLLGVELDSEEELPDQGMPF